MSEINFINYEKSLKDIWDKIIIKSNSYSFLHRRDYMEYHKNRFKDLSFLVKIDNLFVGAIPGEIKNDTFTSHAGLTFGGLIVKQSKSSKSIEIMNHFIEHLRNSGIRLVRISRMPDIYKDSIDDGDLYSLLKNGFHINKFSLSQVIDLRFKCEIPSSKLRGANKAEKNGVEIIESCKSDNIITLAKLNTLLKYGVNITHTAEEMNYLINIFPENILCYEIYVDTEFLGGAILYKSKNVNHLQYLATSEKGRKLRSQDLLLKVLIQKTYEEQKFFSFGSSTEDNGKTINENLMRAKEEFGATSIVSIELEKII